MATHRLFNWGNPQCGRPENVRRAGSRAATL